MRILESFSRFEVRAQIKYWIFLKSFAFVYGSFQDRRSVSDISAVNLIVAWCLLACSVNLAISSLLAFHIEKMSLNYESFPNERFCVASAKDICFYFCHEDVGKSHRHFRTHNRAMGL